MEKKDKSVKIIILLIIMVFAFVVAIALLVKFNIINISQTDKNDMSYLDNISKEKLCDGIWYYYDEGLGVYVLLDETGTERQKVQDEEGLEYYKEAPERLFYIEGIYSVEENEIEDNTIVE